MGVPNETDYQLDHLITLKRVHYSKYRLKSQRFLRGYKSDFLKNAAFAKMSIFGIKFVSIDSIHAVWYVIMV